MWTEEEERGSFSADVLSLSLLSDSFSEERASDRPLSAASHLIAVSPSL